MANKTPTVDTIQTIYGHVHRITWANMANGDIGIGPDGSSLGLTSPVSADRSVQLTGTFGVGGTCVIQGTNMSVDPTATAPTWATLNDPLGSALSLTSAGIKQINEITAGIRPNITGGDGTTSITVTMVIKGTL